ncbi:MAG: SIR2 family protein [Sulfuricurvum sp.]|nr:SIR2 family protein [Sulfuricurvum sp.]
MNNQTYLLSNEHKIEILDDVLMLNGKVYTERAKEAGEEVNVEYRLPDKTETEITAKALELTRTFYKKRLEKLLPAEQLFALTGAGSSIGFGGKSMAGLWDEIDVVKAFEAYIGEIGIEQALFDRKDLESILSRAKLYLAFKPNDTLEKLIEGIEETIKNLCNFKLEDTSTHLEFIKQLTSRKSKQGRLKVFTTNYDTVFEQTASEGSYVVIDGFSFTQPRRFNGKYFDYDIVIRENSRIAADENFASNVFHLYKLHGSVNWETRGEEILQVENPAKAMMIYPNNNKFESSYEQPYFEMMGRLQSELRKKGTTTLIIIGFSFADKHIFTMIKEALNYNASLNLMIIEPFINSITNENFTYLHAYAQKSIQVTIVGEFFKEFVGQLPKNGYFVSHEVTNG